MPSLPALGLQSGLGRWLATWLAMLAFAANSLLCRQALAHEHIDAASFTAIRLGSGALMLALLLLYRRDQAPPTLSGLWHSGSWSGAFALLGYAAAFSLAYNHLTAATGALILFGMVQVSMIGYGLLNAERINATQWLGTLGASGGLLWLMLPGVQAPPLAGALLMAFSGICWGVYSLLGRGSANPVATTAGHFLRATPVALLALPLYAVGLDVSLHGVWQGYAYAIASGALASGLGYALWYAVLPQLSAASGAMIQLSVPVLSAFGGVLLLGESLSHRFLIASALVLCGIGLFLQGRRQRTD